MKLSTRTRFGLRIMVQIAVEGDEFPVFARRIADTQDISQAYVDQILLPLRTGGLLRSLRGRRGGYLLSRPASAITVLDVVEVLEGPLSLVACLDEEEECERSPSCVTRRVWKGVANTIRETLGSITLEELKKQQKQLQTPDNYVI